MPLDEGFSSPPLRFRRFGGGYRREDVELLLAELRLTVRALELELGTLRDRARDLESQLRSARSEIDTFHEKGYELARAMASARRRAEEIEETARERAAAIVAHAEAAASRAEDEARQRLEARARELQALDRVRADLLASLRRVTAEVEESVARAEAEQPLVEVALPAATNGVQAEDGEPEAVYAERVELDAGPFADYESLSAFEQELARIPKVEDVHVQELDGERAVIELRMSERAPLVAEMREHLSYALRVRSAIGNRVVLDLAGTAGEAP